jgi:3-oxoacyl-[acyl-carrier protein] reductase
MTNQKTVLITGASRGIGKACALLFAKHHYHVFLNACHSLSELENIVCVIREQGGHASVVAGDIGNPDVVDVIFHKIKEETDHLDVLVNNAGISQIGLFQDLTNENWDQILATNLSSAIYCSRGAIPLMLPRKFGRILNISSMWGVCGASCEVAYSTTKAGLNGFTKALAKELAPSNILVNAIACGVIDTQMNACFTDEERQQLQDEIPMGRFATAEEVAALVFDLAEGHSYLTGQIIGLDGGFL